MRSLFLLLLFTASMLVAPAQDLFKYNLSFSALPDQWDKALPLGNGMLGALVWQKEGRLRFSLDRADLWDERQALDLTKFDYKWVEEQVLKNQYDTVQQLGDKPYGAFPYPTKIPAGAMEFNMPNSAKVSSATVDIKTATAKVIWNNGTELTAFVDATEPFGAFRFTHIAPGVEPVIRMPHYRADSTEAALVSLPQDGQSLANLGYVAGTLDRGRDHIRYIQLGSKGFAYEVSVYWKYNKDTLEGVWSIATYPGGNGHGRGEAQHVARDICREKLALSFNDLIRGHLQWWKSYWLQSSVSLPDSLLQKQYYLEMYKFGSVARKGAPPITLQAVWTADDGDLPPWKGDVHNDLNTQLSYWPAYTGNHLQEGASFTDWLWKVKGENEKYTRQYFGVKGLNVPGVATLSGKPMGGWIQYAMSPTTSAWMTQYFYWQWKYSMDPKFLKERAYPYLHEVAKYLSGITQLRNGKRVLPLSSSPEMHDNSVKAWYPAARGNTNFDIALMRYAYGVAAKAAAAMGKDREARRWEKERSQLPEFAIDSTGMMLAASEELSASHRHHSHMLAIYPLGLLNPDRPEDKVVIDRSLRWLEKLGTRAWNGYSFSWAANLYARAKEGNQAARALHIFTTNFCSPNSFHLNGDQHGGQYSASTSSPFTLEGNFAFAGAVHEMLLQSYSGEIEVFPAVPDSWQEVSFHDLRAEGAFLVGARRLGGRVTQIEVKAEKGGTARIKLPFKTWSIASGIGVKSHHFKEGVLTVDLKKGGVVLIKNDN